MSSNILQKDFNTLWNTLWGDYVTNQYKNEKNVAYEKFRILKSGVIIDNTLVDLETLIKNSKTNWTEPEWGFPKGRRNYNEKDISCAIREFEEETGYTNDDLDVLYNIIPYEEIFTGSNFKSYKHKYYLAQISNNLNLEHFEESEVSNLQLFTYEECMSKIRDYNLEKKKMITNVSKILDNFKIIN